MRVGRITISSRGTSIKGIPISGTISREGIQMLRSPQGPWEIVLYQPLCPAIDLCGAGEAHLEDVDQPKLTVDMAGAGSITAAGRVSELNLRMSGAGNARLERLRANQAHVVATGAGNISVSAWDTVTARLSGVGDLNIAGEPQAREVRHFGVGQVHFTKAANGAVRA